MSEITEVLHAIDGGDPSAAESLLPLVYEELRRLAAARMARETPDQTLQATALVHEAYLRLVGAMNGQKWDGRGHFFAAAAEAMRRILIDNARKKQRRKMIVQRRAASRASFGDADDSDAEQLLILDDALTLLAGSHAETAEVVKLRHYGGLTIEQTADALGISIRTANRHWAFARAYLYQQIHGDEHGSN